MLYRQISIGIILCIFVGLQSSNLKVYAQNRAAKIQTDKEDIEQIRKDTGADQ